MFVLFVHMAAMRLASTGHAFWLQPRLPASHDDVSRTCTCSHRLPVLRIERLCYRSTTCPALWRLLGYLLAISFNVRVEVILSLVFLRVDRRPVAIKLTNLHCFHR